MKRQNYFYMVGTKIERITRICKETPIDGSSSVETEIFVNGVWLSAPWCNRTVKDEDWIVEDGFGSLEELLFHAARKYPNHQFVFSQKKAIDLL